MEGLPRRQGHYPVVPARVRRAATGRDFCGPHPLHPPNRQVRQPFR
jgi:hypothetical protein